ncbi:MAG TPA: CBS domain-containing protein [Caulobacteraceae bacterium]|nr:CBS domain-containing protein [Caulobacteraceae bacterium]
MRRLSDIVCNQNPLTLPATASVKSACEHMSRRRAGSVLVTDEEGLLVGIFTGRDAVGRVLAAGKSPARTQLGEVMTADPVVMSPELTAIDALRRMWDGGFRHVPLVDGRKIVGVVSRGDFQGDEHSRLEEERELWEHMR